MINIPSQIEVGDEGHYYRIGIPRLSWGMRNITPDSELDPLGQGLAALKAALPTNHMWYGLHMH